MRTASPMAVLAAWEPVEATRIQIRMENLGTHLATLIDEIPPRPVVGRNPNSPTGELGFPELQELVLLHVVGRQCAASVPKGKTLKV